SVTAMNNQTLWAFAISLGIASGGGPESSGTAFTVAINIISTSPTIFTRSNSSGIIAELENADVKAVGVTLLADDNSMIYAVAGALGIGTEGSAYGVGLGWNQIALEVEANIDNANVTAASDGVSLTAESTQDGPIKAIGAAGSFAGKIAAGAIGGAGGNSTAV